MAAKKKQTKKAVKKVMSKKTVTKNGNGSSGSSLVFPRKLLGPVGDFLSEQLGRLERRRNSLTNDDPFSSSRGDENFASPDTNAAEQFGHARTEALRGEIDKRIVQLRKALARVKIGSYGICENCSKMIDTDRLVIFPEATLCISCEKKAEKK